VRSDTFPEVSSQPYTDRELISTDVDETRQAAPSAGFNQTKSALVGEMLIRSRALVLQSAKTVQDLKINSDLTSHQPFSGGVGSPLRHQGTGHDEQGRQRTDVPVSDDIVFRVAPFRESGEPGHGAQKGITNRVMELTELTSQLLERQSQTMHRSANREGLYHVIFCTFTVGCFSQFVFTFNKIFCCRHMHRAEKTNVLISRNLNNSISNICENCVVKYCQLYASVDLVSFFLKFNKSIIY